MKLQEIRDRLLDSFNNPEICDSLRGDENLSQLHIADKTLIPAAVLVPIVNRSDALTLLFTQRTKHLANHAGQISFPGGHMEFSDKSANETALRESEEEVGIKPDGVEVIGRLNQYLTRTGFSVTPIVGIINQNYSPSPDPLEVAEVFEVPLNFFLDSKNYQQHRYTKNGLNFEYTSINYNTYYIWGVTAGIIKNFYDIVVS